jgi:CO dehydrogenase nickel-insertion accessory protein CooC1
MRDTDAALGETQPPGHRSRTEEGIHFLVLGKMGHREPGAGCDGPIAKIARDLRVQTTSAVCVSVVDFKAGFEDPARGSSRGSTGRSWSWIRRAPRSKWPST